MNKKWTERDKEFLRDNAESMTDEEIAKQLGKFTAAAVRKMRQRLGIRKQRGRGVCGLDREER
jgi:hypothetical protein